MSSKMWLSKNGLVARKLTILDALSPTMVSHKTKYVPILDKHVVAKVFDEVKKSLQVHVFRNVLVTLILVFRSFTIFLLFIFKIELDFLETVCTFTDITSSPCVK